MASTAIINKRDVNQELAIILSNLLLSLRFPHVKELEQKGKYDKIMKLIPLSTQTALKSLLSQYDSNCFEDLILSPQHPLDYQKDPIGPFILSLKKCAKMVHPHHFINKDNPLAIRMYYEASFPPIQKKSTFNKLFRAQLHKLHDELSETSGPSIFQHFDMERRQDKKAWKAFLPQGSTCKVVKGVKPCTFIFIIETHAGQGVGEELHDIIRSENPTVERFAKDPRVQWANSMVYRNASRVMACILDQCEVSYYFADDTQSYVPKHHKYPKMVGGARVNSLRHNTFRIHDKHVSFYHGCVDGKQMYIPDKYFLFSSHNPLCGDRVLFKSDWHAPIEPKELHQMIPVSTPFEMNPLTKGHHKKLRRLAKDKKKYHEHSHAPFHRHAYSEKIMDLLGCTTDHNNVELKVVHIYPPLK